VTDLAEIWRDARSCVIGIRSAPGRGERSYAEYRLVVDGGCGGSVDDASTFQLTRNEFHAEARDEFATRTRVRRGNG